MQRSDTTIFILNQLTDIVVGNGIEDLDVTATLPEIIHSVVHNGYITNNEYESYKKINKRVQDIFKLLDHELNYFNKIQRVKKRRDDYIDKLAGYSKEKKRNKALTKNEGVWI